jgi:hypothetical protein
VTRIKLYALVASGVLVGYVYLLYYAISPSRSLYSGPTVCLIKNVTGFPCPSCGSTRTMISFIHGDYAGALYWNPIGLILLLAMVVLPFWILLDVVKKKNSFFTFYQKFELFIKQKPVVLVGVILILTNWIWNINKGL